MTDYPRYQYSKMSADKSEQYVVRGDDKEEFELDVTYLKTKGEIAKTFPDQPNQATKTFDTTTVQSKFQEMCQLHNVQLVWSEQPSKKSGKKYKYHKTEDGSFCFGR